MTDTTNISPLHTARRRDGEHRRNRVQQAITEMRADGTEITVSSVAARARVHRSFIHRHRDLHADVLRAAAEAVTAPAPTGTTLSHRSALAENANLHARVNRYARQVNALEDRLSDMLGQQAFERSGLGASHDTAAVQQRLEEATQTIIDMRQALDERDEELAAARETVRQLMTRLNRAP